LSGCAAPAHRVVSVADGDTITVLKDEAKVKIRLAGIDAPESQQAYGQASKKHLSDLVYERDVTLVRISRNVTADFASS
jgi:micrococcal nuclease